MSFATLFPRFQLRLTRWGGLFLLAVFLLAVAAVNTGNNALMLLLGLSLGTYLVSGAWSREVLKHLSVEVVPPPELFADQPAPFEVRLINRSKVFPGYGVVLRDSAGESVLAEPCVPARESVRRVIQLKVDRRGWVDLAPWRVEVLLPLGFFVKSKEAVQNLDVLVYPRLLKRGAKVQVLDQGHRSWEQLRGRGREGEVTQLRDFKEGDERRQIHWKQTARQRRLIVTDRQRPASEPEYLLLDNRVNDPDDAVLKESFERQVSETATSVVRRLERGEAVGIVIGGRLVEAVTTPARARLLLRPLAEVELERVAEEARGAPPFGARGVAR
jgi:uncharacterized protein (DUF58 family)